MQRLPAIAYLFDGELYCPICADKHNIPKNEPLTIEDFDDVDIAPICFKCEEDMEFFLCSQKTERKVKLLLLT